MILVAIRDRISGKFSEPHLEQNKACAVRWFNNILDQTKFKRDDFELFALGVYDIDTGKIIALDFPEYVEEREYE